MAAPVGLVREHGGGRRRPREAASVISAPVQGPLGGAACAGKPLVAPFPASHIGGDLMPTDAETVQAQAREVEWSCCLVLLLLLLLDLPLGVATLLCLVHGGGPGAILVAALFVVAVYITLRAALPLLKRRRRGTLDVPIGPTDPAHDSEPAIDRARELYRAGHSLGEIASILNQERYLPPSGDEFTAESVGEVLDLPERD